LTAGPTDPRRPGHTDAGPNWKRRALVAGGVVLAIFMALNSQKVEVNFIFGSAQMPLIFALLIAAALGALVGWATPRLRSSRSRDAERK
jgi:uncharacterized integral membrane protein